MRRMKTLQALAVVALLACGSGARGADSRPAPGGAMKLDDPMPIKMKKQGMKKGDVKKAAEKKQREMKPMMEKESAGGGKK
jgi:hypothetical protein